MKIVVLDGYALNPGDLNWDGLAALGDLTVHEHSTADQVVERAAGAEVLLTNKCPVGAEQTIRPGWKRHIDVVDTNHGPIEFRYLVQFYHQPVFLNANRCRNPTKQNHEGHQCQQTEDREAGPDICEFVETKHPTLDFTQIIVERNQRPIFN